MKKSLCIYLCGILSAAIVVIGSGKLFFDWMSIEVIKLQTLEAEYAWVNKKPIEVELKSKKDLPQKIEALGLKLYVPWKDKSLIEKDNNLYTIESENFHIAIMRQKELLTADTINTIIDKRKINYFYSSLAKNYGQQVICSKYKLDEVIVNITHDNLDKCYSNKKLDMMSVLIRLKCQVIPSTAETGIYYFEKDLIRGFQFGTESKIILWVYNNEDEKYQISISRKAHAHTRITKSILDEVNEILPTIEFINE